MEDEMALPVCINENIIRLALGLSESIDNLNLTTRTYNGLKRWGVNTVADLCRAYMNGELPKIRNMGEKSIYETEHMLYTYFKGLGIETEE